MAPVLKTGVGLRPPWVRIPLPPPEYRRVITIEWGGARVVEWGRLLSGCWVYSSTEGSNPSLPALPFARVLCTRAFAYHKKTGQRKPDMLDFYLKKYYC